MTTDEDYRLVEEGERFELIRFWRSGGHSFKFVFDGTWRRHLGSAGENRLIQPGQEIRLSIPTSGEYAISLDVKQCTWSLEPRPIRRPRAIITIVPIGLGRIVLDSSASVVRSGREINYSWRVTAPALSDEDWSFREEGGKGHLSLSKEGRFEITLRVVDGEFQNETTESAQLGVGYEVCGRDRGVVPRPMRDLGDGTWAAVYRIPPAGRDLYVRSLNDKSELASQRLTSKSGKPVLVRYAPRTGRLSAEEQGWHRVRWKASDGAGLPAGSHVDRVDLVGSFNDWRADRTPMKRIGMEAFEAILRLSDGLYPYKLLVNGSVYLEDPGADPRYATPDGHGGRNSGFLIGVDAREFGLARPRHITSAALRHDPNRTEYFARISRDMVRVAARTLADDVEQVRLVFGAKPGRTIDLRRTDNRWGYDYWSAQVRAGDAAMSYRLVFDDDSARAVLTAAGVESEERGGKPFRGDAGMSFTTPDWAKEVVWYQIFPERFRNGNPDNDPPRCVPWTHRWDVPYKPPPGTSKGSSRDFRERGDFYNYIFKRRYGGDLQGIREKLPYLRDLGVTGIYLNPIFLAASLHKYDASDYRHIDDYFGIAGSLEKLQGETADPATWQWSQSDRMFLDFLNEAHRLGFKVILDGVFNHVGRAFWAFEDVLKNGEASAYADWFDIESWEPFEYLAWDKKNGALPRLKHDEALGLHRPVRDHIFAITRRWMDPDGDGDPSDGIDGWRLDVAADINANFWRDWRKLVKSINSDAYIVAELWEESRQWLNGETFDAVMNYPFARGTQAFFVNRKKALKPSKFGERLDEMLRWYPPQVNYVLQNLIASHDTDRPASMFMNPDLEYDQANRIQDNGPQYNPSKPTQEAYRKLNLFHTFQMTFLGAPMTYYGDEVGMYGADDPSDRKPMLWPDLMPYDDSEERIESEVFDHARRMIAVRNTLPALRLGSFRTLHSNDRSRIFAFARSLDNETVVVVLNNSDKPRRLNIPSPWPDGSKIDRLDDPKQFEVVAPPDDRLQERPIVRKIEGGGGGWKVVDGRLRGGVLPARSGGVFVRRGD